MEKVTLELTPQEALILFEVLSRWSETNEMSMTLEHRAEQRVLWNILATLESTLSEPFLPDYQERLKYARDSLQSSGE